MAQITTSEPPTLGNRQRAAGSANGMSSVPSGATLDAGADQALVGAVAAGLTEGQWLQRAQLVNRASTQWFDAGMRQTIQRNYAHFKGRHAAGTKYASANYSRHRSALFRPKTRSMTRRTEAAAAVAFFSTADLLSVSAFDDSDIDQRDAATVAQAVLQYRLENTSMRWFQTVVGAVQDAGVSGVCISRQEWMYRTSGYKAVSNAGITDEQDVLEDRPTVTLIPAESFRFDPGCDWRDPINTSPYLIEKAQRYACDIDADARRINKATGERIYVELSAREWMMASRRDYDSIRTERLGQHVDKYDQETGIPDYNVIVTYRHVMRVDDVDWYFETLDDLMLLSVPKPVEEVFPHLQPGERPYCMGSLTIEAHNPLPDSPTAIIAPVQEETNELANLRIDTNRMALMSRWAVRRGANVDVPTLMSSIPGSGIVMDNISTDLRELKTNDVGQAAFAQEDRLNLDIDEASGNFSLASIASNRKLGETVGGMNLLSGDANQVKEYELRTFSETWVEPVLNQLYALESAYETDRALLQQVVASSKLPLKRVLEVMALKVRVRVNVGFNATSPEKRIGKLTTAAAALNQLFPEWVQQKANKGEFAKEIFGALGYKDSDRFIPDDAQDEDPEKQQLREQVAQLQQMLQGKVLETQSREKIAQLTVEGRLRQASMDNETKRYLGELTTRIEVGRLRLEQMDRMLAAEAVDTDRKQLSLEREALSHQVQMDTAQLISSLAGMNEPVDGADVDTPSKPSGAPPTGGDDRAGVISRDRYGDVPFQQG